VAKGAYAKPAETTTVTLLLAVVPSPFKSLIEGLLSHSGGVGDFQIQQEESIQREAFDPSA
jgi:hypothetical protein